MTPPRKKKPNSYNKAGRKRFVPPRGKKEGSLWDQAARWYDSLVGEEGSDYQKTVVMPGAHRLLQLKKSETVLDLACGQGVFSRYLHEKGANVLGLDISDPLIRLARKRSPREIQFVTADAADAKALKPGQFDAVACLLAMQNMAQLEPVLQNVSRWLKPSGRLVVVLTHPCFRIPRQTHWGWDDDKKIQFRRIDWYQSETEIPILTPPFATSKSYTVTYHRPLQKYFQALGQAGLAVDSLEEWASDKKSQPGKRARAENRARREVPLFLALRAIPVKALNP